MKLFSAHMVVSSSQGAPKASSALQDMNEVGPILGAACGKSLPMEIKDVLARIPFKWMGCMTVSCGAVAVQSQGGKGP